MPSNVSRIYADLGDVFGRAAEARRSIWGQAISNISGIPTQIIAAKQQAQHDALQQQRQQAMLDMERERLQMTRDEAAAKSSDQQATEQVIAAMFADPAKPDPNAGIQKAIELGKGHLVPFIHQTAAAVAPHLEKIDTIDDQGNPITRWVSPSAEASYPKEAPKITYGADIKNVLVDDNPAPVSVRTATQGQNSWLVDLQGNKVTGTKIREAPPAMTPYQTEELNIQRQRLKKETGSEAGWSTTTVHDPDTGQDVLMRVNARSGQAEVVNLPANLAAGKAVKLPATAQDHVASLTVLKQEAGKVQRLLKDTGLDQSNDPIGPRARTLIATKLGIATNDPRVDDMVQRIQFVRATALRTLAGSRGGKWVMEQMTPHLPDSVQSGKKASETLQNVIEQADELIKAKYDTAGIPVPKSVSTGKTTKKIGGFTVEIEQ